MSGNDDKLNYYLVALEVLEMVAASENREPETYIVYIALLRNLVDEYRKRDEQLEIEKRFAKVLAEPDTRQQ